MILKDLKQDFHLSLFQNYGNLTHETRIKDAVNMEALTCLFTTVRTLKQLFQLQKWFPKWRQRLVKNVKKKNRFWSNSSKFRVVRIMRFCSNLTSMWYKHFSRNVWRDYRLPMSALATVAGKSFNGKFTAKIDFPIGYVMLPLLMLTLEI